MNIPVYDLVDPIHYQGLLRIDNCTAFGGTFIDKSLQIIVNP